MNESSTACTTEPVSFVSGTHEIDARLHRPEGAPRGGMVVCHPHPAHGGHMDHPVVVLLAETAARRGLLTLRLDVRGVRRSEGDVTDLEGHLEDVRRAIDLIRNEDSAPQRPLLGSGFSYGARLLAQLASAAPAAPLGFAGLLLLAPATRVPRTPRDFGNLLLGRPLDEAARDAPAAEALGRIPVRTRVLVGDRDVVAPVDELAEALSPSTALTVLAGLNHFFSRGQGASATADDVLRPAIETALDALLPRSSSWQSGS